MAGIEVRIVDPKRVRHFAQSAGRLAKNDPIDAEMIAWFGETFADGSAGRTIASASELDRLVSARTDLKASQGTLGPPGRARPAGRGPPRPIRQIAKTCRAAGREARGRDRQAGSSQTRSSPSGPRIIESVPGLGISAPPA